MIINLTITKNQWRDLVMVINLTITKELQLFRAYSRNRDYLIINAAGGEFV